MDWVDQQGIRFNKQGLVPVVTQDESGEVLMLAYADKEALRLTLKTRKAHYFSRSRQKLWLKGETSGNIQEVQEVLVDCDQDTVLYRVKQEGVACHTGNRSCFYRKIR